MSADYKTPSFDRSTLCQALDSGSCRLVDLEWRFAVTARHSLIANHTECLIQLRLELEGGTQSSLHLELTMAQFNELFREMEKVNNMLSIIN